MSSLRALQVRLLRHLDERDELIRRHKQQLAACTKSIEGGQIGYHGDTPVYRRVPCGQQAHKCVHGLCSACTKAAELFNEIKRVRIKLRHVCSEIGKAGQ